MRPSILANLTLGYQLVWDRQREPAGVELFVGTHPGAHQESSAASVDGAHLLSALAQAWSADAPLAILFVQSADLLAQVLAHASPGGARFWIGVEDNLLANGQVAAQVSAAHARGMQLVWRGAPGRRPRNAEAGLFARHVFGLTAGEALVALAASVRAKKGEASGEGDLRQPSWGAPGATPPTRAPANHAASPVVADQIYEGVASRLLASHCLDERGAWGVAGWPMDDVMQHAHQVQQQQIQPSRQAILRLIEAADADLSLERIEQLLVEEPILVYQLLRYANSAALGLRTGIDSLRHALMVLGLSTFKRWLEQQLPHASSDIELQPVRTGMVVRARLMELMLDAGEEDKLRSEIFLCGLLSQIDLVLGEPMATALQRFPVSERITEAILGKSGPYAPYLEIASALEYPSMGKVLPLCEANQIDIGDVNRSLLRVLSQAQSHKPQPR